MRIAVFGLGYVGSVAAACLAREGHTVIGVDPSVEKVGSINAGLSPVREPGLSELVKSVTEAGSLSATGDAPAAVDSSDLALICVGTPSQPDGSLDLSHVKTVAREIGTALVNRKDHYTVVVRSTVLPGTTRDVIVPELEASSKRGLTADFDVIFHPEFLREGTSLDDYQDPPKIIIGTEQGKPNHALNELYEDFDCPRTETTYEVAELAKYVDNTWHALKVSFANEVGRMSKAAGIDGREVMEILVSDTKLNISARYLKPGFAYGGSCLPKDLSALTWSIRETGLTLPLVEAINRSNDEQIESAIRAVRQIGNRNVGMLGLTFKANTDDLRSSPFVDMACRLIDLGFVVRASDPNIDMDTLIGANRTYLNDKLPDAEGVIASSLEEVLEFAETVVLGKDEPRLLEAAKNLREDQHLLDLVGMGERPIQGGYVGIGW